MWEWMAKLGNTFRLRTGFQERMCTVEPHHIKVRKFLLSSLIPQAYYPTPTRMPLVDPRNKLRNLGERHVDNSHRQQLI